MRRAGTWLVTVAALLTALTSASVHAQTFPGAGSAVGVVTTLDGRAMVARPAIPSPLALRFKDDVFGRDKISTQENSLVRVLLGGKAILTVRELSQVWISEEPGRAVVTLPDGKVVLAVAKQRMRPGESIEIHTPNAVAAVRGSIMAVAYDVSQKLTTAICHAGDCTFQYGNGPTVPLLPGQGAKNNQIGPVSAAERLAAVDVQTSSRPFNSPDSTFLNTLVQNQTSQAVQVAQFVNTGGLLPIGNPVAIGSPGTPTVTTAPINALTNTSDTAITAGNNPGTPPPPAGVELVVNGGFETGDFSGWTQSGALDNTNVVGTRFYVHSGNFGAHLGPIPADGFLSQTLATVASKPYIISFALRSDGGLPNDFSASWGGQTIFARANMPLGDWMPLSFTEVATGSSTVLQFGFRNVPSFLGLDDVSVMSDPPLYFLGSGDTFTRTGTDPLLRLTGVPQTFDSLMVVCCGGRATLAGPLLQAMKSDLTVRFSLVSLFQGGSLVSTSTDPLVQLQGGTHNFGSSVGLPMFDIAGLSTASDTQTGLTLGTDRPLQTAGPLLATSGATVNAYQAVRVDTALLEATAPLVALAAGTNFTTATDALTLAYQAKVTSLGSLVRLDASTLSVAHGPALNVAGGSVVNVMGDLFTLVNGSSLRLLNGPLVSLSGSSVLTVNGALVAFGGTAANTISVSNSLCPCTMIAGIPVNLTGGALANNVSITGTAVKNPGLGTITLSSPNAAVIRVDGAATKLTIKGL